MTMNNDAPTSLRVVRDIPYGPAADALRLGDLYLPSDAAPDTPCLLLIHGGGWRGGDRLKVAGVAEFLCRDLGFAVFNIEYRLASAANRWPNCGDDCLSAARFLLSGAMGDMLGASPRKIWICGVSSGGHLALWTLLHLPDDAVTAAISISSIGDPVPDFGHRYRYEALFGEDVSEGSLRAMDPVPLVRPGLAPLLCTHAVGDEVVPVASHRAFADAYRAAGNACDFFEYPHDAEPNTGGHFIWRTPNPPRPLLRILENRIASFVRDCRNPADRTSP